MSDTPGSPAEMHSPLHIRLREIGLDSKFQLLSSEQLQRVVAWSNPDLRINGSLNTTMC
ncbi:hypothetical protein PGTUg99_025965 [Puccinia graminis f. sp. tritici]|uniref:Uncharacterized protein n=1 Tax=Puccinia graminis f. sp. tritici TaxID=56615 RepID=A0A5B0RGR7_PUCGR|nr:hypothetical protein PGTUg99_025965 [Puccinia graminis f. sp. tritici]